MAILRFTIILILAQGNFRYILTLAKDINARIQSMQVVAEIFSVDFVDLIRIIVIDIS